MKTMVAIATALAILVGVTPITASAKTVDKPVAAKAKPAATERKAVRKSLARKHLVKRTHRVAASKPHKLVKAKTKPSKMIVRAAGRRGKPHG